MFIQIRRRELFSIAAMLTISLLDLAGGGTGRVAFAQYNGASDPYGGGYPMQATQPQSGNQIVFPPGFGAPGAPSTQSNNVGGAAAFAMPPGFAKAGMVESSLAQDPERYQEPVYSGDPASLSMHPASKLQDKLDEALDNSNSAAPRYSGEYFEDGRLVALVGSEYVLAGDLMGFVQPILDENAKRIPASQLPQIREQLMRQVLKQYVGTKAMYQEFFREMIGSKPPKEYAETKDGVLNKARKMFYDSQLPSLLKRNECQNMVELELKLREKGQSLRALEMQFIETVMAQELVRSHVPDKPEIHIDMVWEDYKKNIKDWERPARCRWRMMSVEFNKFNNNKEAAYQAILEMWNSVYYGGAPFEAVAKQKSQDVYADKGGVYDWTTKGSLRSEVIDQAIFELPTNRLSPIIEDSSGFHIVEVLEREPGKTIDFSEAQLEIRSRMQNERRDADIEKFKAEVMKTTVIWTLWPEDIPGSRPLISEPQLTALPSATQNR